MEDTEMMEQDVAGVEESGAMNPPGLDDDDTHGLHGDAKQTDAHDFAPSISANPVESLEKQSNGSDAHEPLGLPAQDPSTPKSRGNVEKPNNWLLDPEMGETYEDGTPDERAAFMKELETFHKEHSLDFKPPKFYGEPLNCLKLWRSVIRLGGYELVTASKLWRQVGESFHPPKTCTTVSWTFRIFYEKALLEYEKFKTQNGEIQLPASSLPPPSGEKEPSYQASGSGRARRDAAARAMQGWHAQRYHGYGEVTGPIIKDKSSTPAPRQKNLKSIGLQKHKATTTVEMVPMLTELDKHWALATQIGPSRMHGGAVSMTRKLVPEVVDVGTPADWVKINVRETKDCFEVYALVPGMLREEVRVQSDPAGRLVITGQPEQVENPWGITPFKKVVSLPGRIDPLQTTAVVSLHGRLFIRVPFEQG